MAHELWAKFTAHLDWWLLFGIIFQLAFTARFLVQWIASERSGQSVIPISFWYLSLIGSTGVLIYGVGRGDPVIILGQAFGTIVYIRNLMLIYRGQAQRPATKGTPPPQEPG
jgi:lipid-A-disaccharide synthase-like uncharacterized protein